MKLIEKLSEKISEEISDGRCYVKMALEYKDEYPDMARTLYEISTEEIDHMNMLHSTVVNLIEEYRRTNGDPPASMLAVYEYLHKKQIEKANKVKAIQAMFKES